MAACVWCDWRITDQIPFPSDEIIKERAGLRKQLCAKFYYRCAPPLWLSHACGRARVLTSLHGWTTEC